MLTLVELSGINLHVERLGVGTLKVRSDMTATEPGGPAWRGRLLGGGRPVSVFVAIAIVVADMIGVGVFTSLGFQVKDIPSGFSILMLWIVGGLVALCGVFSYSELGAMFPRSSSKYNFLSRAYHPAFGFLAVGYRRPSASQRRSRWPRWHSANTANRSSRTRRRRRLASA